MSMTAFEIYVNGSYADTVYYDKTMSISEVKASMEKEGWKNITKVKKVRI